MYIAEHVENWYLYSEYFDVVDVSVESIYCVIGWWNFSLLLLLQLSHGIVNCLDFTVLDKFTFSHLFIAGEKNLYVQVKHALGIVETGETVILKMPRYIEMQ